MLRVSGSKLSRPALCPQSTVVGFDTGKKMKEMEALARSYI